MRKLIFAASLIFCAGCMPTFQSQSVSPYVPKYEKIDLGNYNIGQIQEKNVGEAMLTIIDGTAAIYDGYKAVMSYQPPDYVAGMGTVVKWPPINEGSDWTLYGTMGEGHRIYISDSYKTTGCIVSDATDLFYGITGCSSSFVLAWPQKILGILKPSEKITKYNEGSLKQELVYTGKSKDTIKLQYREYKDNFARPAFFQDLSYDLSESKEIGFRGMMIEIIEATNSKIKFIVKSKMI